MTYFTRFIAKLSLLQKNISNIDKRFDEIKLNQGLILSSLNQNKNSRALRDYEFTIFSQWGEDGIIQHLVNTIEIKNKTFIEFGVEDFFESNCRFLLMKDDWKGFVIDGSSSNVEKCKNSYFYWKHQLVAVSKFITKENINEILGSSEFEDDLGILSIDLDGNDYYILEAINYFKPRILICEFNPVFGATRKISVPYQADFQRTNSHYSNLYWGASLAAITYLADKRGYVLTGTNTACNNAFFIRKDLVNPSIEILSSELAYQASNYRESRDKVGNLTYLNAENRLDLIKGLPVLEVEKNIIEPL